MGNVLFVPIHLDALYIERERAVTGPMADFSKLPYQNDTAHGEYVPNISEQILSQPFQNKNLILKPGLHLHWALPDALTKSSGKEFPAMPDRWLVTRYVTNENKRILESQWVVESNYIHPHPSGKDAGAVSYPFPGFNNNGIPFRYLGRKMLLSFWKEGGTEQYLHPISAVGYGEPAFAAFYPNCHSVLGFHDTVPPDFTTIEYEVLGWYSRLEDDYLGIFTRRARQLKPTIDHNGLYELIQKELGWKINSREELPQQLLCFATVKIEKESLGNASFDPAAEPLKVAVGHNSMEALSAYLANTINAGNKKEIEQQLAAIHLADHFEKIQLDRGAKFFETYHEKEFRAVGAGAMFTLKLDPFMYNMDTGQVSSDIKPGIQDKEQYPEIAVPEELAKQLVVVNALQKEYEREKHEISATRKQLFSDWYKYMLCMYPPEGDGSSYPDIDEAKYLIERELLSLEKKKQACGVLTLQKEEVTGTISHYEATPPGSLAARLQEALDKLSKAVDSDNRGRKLFAPLTKPGDGPAVREYKVRLYTLKQQSAPRYWQPNEPVVLVAGEAAKASLRHGHDGRMTDDNTLTCFTWQADGTTSISEHIRTNYTSVTNAIRKVQQQLKEESADGIGFSEWEQQPWNPFLLEWEVEVFPLKNKSNVGTESSSYHEDFIRHGYNLTQKEPDLQPANSVTFAKAANVYSGSCVLTPHAGIQMKRRIYQYLEKVCLPEYYAEKKITANEQEDYLKKKENCISVREWYEANRLSVEKKASDPVCNALRALACLADLKAMHFLSQALGGFNEALLQHKETLQLDIEDPLGFPDYQKFTEAVRQVVSKSPKSAPLPWNDFNPIRTGGLKINRLRLIDTFGRSLELDVSRILSPEKLAIAGSPMVSLPPRLTQPARLNFRWLPSSVTTSLPGSYNPFIVGWLLPDFLNNALLIYDNQGKAAGSITKKGEWEKAPGHVTQLIIDGPLKTVVNELTRHAPPFIEDFLETLEANLENITPESHTHHNELALLMGTPLALVRATVGFELKGLAAVNQSWNSFRQDMGRTYRDTDNFTRVKFPIRLGAFQQLNDGLAGYWLEHQGKPGDTFYAPHVPNKANPGIRSFAEAPHHLSLSLDDKPAILWMLVDPRASVHATTGILPVKSINLPAEEYKASLQSIEATFFTGPLITPGRQVRISLPEETGFTWSWLEQTRKGWAERSAAGYVKEELFAQALAGWAWKYVSDKRIGWLQSGHTTATIQEIVLDSKKEEKLAFIQNVVKPVLVKRFRNDANLTREEFHSDLVPGAVSLWTHLLKNDIGWLKAEGDQKVRTTTQGERKAKEFSGEYEGMESVVNHLFDSFCLVPFQYQPSFERSQTIREGWLKLQHVPGEKK